MRVQPSRATKQPKVQPKVQPKQKKRPTAKDIAAYVPSAKYGLQDFSVVVPLAQKTPAKTITKLEVPLSHGFKKQVYTSKTMPNLASFHISVPSVKK
jgi:hypothetical protein